jgi:hypothetical protein
MEKYFAKFLNAKFFSTTLFSREIPPPVTSLSPSFKENPPPAAQRAPLDRMPDDGVTENVPGSGSSVASGILTDHQYCSSTFPELRNGNENVRCRNIFVVRKRMPAGGISAAAGVVAEAHPIGLPSKESDGLFFNLNKVWEQNLVEDCKVMMFTTALHMCKANFLADGYISIPL